jgi:predicted nucleic acid-binding protein
MSVESFLDTNVLVYAASASRIDEAKRTRARALMAKRNFGVSGQVLQEFYVTATRKAAIGMNPVAAQKWLEQLVDRPCVSLDRDLVMLGIKTSTRFKISYWDGAILAAAEALGAATLYTEDLNHGQKYGTVTVINPFK